MSTTLSTSSTAEAPSSAFDQHKADILAGNDGLESGRILGLLLGEIRSNAAVYARRTKLAHDLRVAVPQLEAHARDARDRSDRMLGLADPPFADKTTSDWLVALGLPERATLQEFGQGIAKYMDDRLTSKQQAQDAAMRARDLREQATRELWETASAALHNRLNDARNKMLLALKKIEASDKWLGEIDGKLAHCRERCERLFRGERGTEPLRRRYEIARDQLQKLEAEAATRPQVEAERARNISEHTAALAQRNQTLAAMLLPENMRFHGER